jgi:hypothetical protein
MKNEITHIEVFRLSGTNDWMFELWVNNSKTPSVGLCYESPDNAFYAALEHFKAYTPPQVDVDWRDRIKKIKAEMLAEKFDLD